MAPPATAPKAEGASAGCWQRRWPPVRDFIIKHWLPIIFAVAIIFALAFPQPGTALLKIIVAGDVRIIQEVPMGIVFLLGGLALDTKDLRKAKGHVAGVAYGFAAILIFTPCVGFALRYIPLEPVLFSYGLVFFCVAPTTLGIGLALVRSCKGNDGISLLMTVGTNMLGVVTMPIALKLLFLHFDLDGIDIRIDILNLFLKLLITMFIPSVVGKCLREFVPPVQRFVTRWKVYLGMLSTTCLAFIVWQTLSGARDQLFHSKAWSIVVVIILASSLYLLFQALNYMVIRFAFPNMPTPVAIAVVIMASQKSAPVAVTVISYVTRDIAVQGLLAIPSVVGQLAQIFIGSAMAPAIAKWAYAYNAAHQDASVRPQPPASKDVEAAVAADTTSASSTVEAGPQDSESDLAAKIAKLEVASAPAGTR